MVFHPDSPALPPDDDVEPKSKSQRKREMLELQALGERLAALPPRQLEKFDLPEELLSAIAEARRFTRKNEASRRQMQYIGKLMRSIDPEPIRAQLAALRT